MKLVVHEQSVIVAKHFFLEFGNSKTDIGKLTFTVGAWTVNAKRTSKLTCSVDAFVYIVVAFKWKQVVAFSGTFRYFCNIKYFHKNKESEDVKRHGFHSHCMAPVWQEPISELTYFLFLNKKMCVPSNIWKLLKFISLSWICNNKSVIFVFSNL